MLMELHIVDASRFSRVLHHLSAPEGYPFSVNLQRDQSVTDDNNEPKKTTLYTSGKSYNIDHTVKHNVVDHKIL